MKTREGATIYVEDPLLTLLKGAFWTLSAVASIVIARGELGKGGHELTIQDSDGKVVVYLIRDTSPSEIPQVISYADKSRPKITEEPTQIATSTFVADVRTDAPKIILATLTAPEVLDVFAPAQATPEVMTSFPDDSDLAYFKRSTPTPTQKLPQSPTPTRYVPSIYDTPSTTLVPTALATSTSLGERPLATWTPNITNTPEASTTPSTIVEIVFTGEKNQIVEVAIKEMLQKNMKLITYLVENNLIKSKINIIKEDLGASYFFVFNEDGEKDGSKQITGQYLSSFQADAPSIFKFEGTIFHPFDTMKDEMEFSLQMELGRQIYSSLSPEQKTLYMTTLWDSFYDNLSTRKILEEIDYGRFVTSDQDKFAVDLHLYLRGDKSLLTQKQIRWFETFMEQINPTQKSSTRGVGDILKSMQARKQRNQLVVKS